MSVNTCTCELCAPVNQAPELAERRREEMLRQRILERERTQAKLLRQIKPQPAQPFIHTAVCLA